MSTKDIKIYPSFDSPKLLAVDRFAMTKQTIRSLMGKSNITTYNLCFVKPRNKLPKFGLSIVPIQTLVAIANQSDVEKLPVVKEHFWNETDYPTWNNRLCDNDSPVRITFRLNNNKPFIIQVIFSHENTNSSIYSYKMNAVENDAYLMIFVSKEDINSKRVSLLSNFDYLSQLTGDAIKKGSAEKFVPTECITCCSNLTAMVFLPCGHTPFCQKCDNEYRSSECPICKQDFEEKVLRTMAANFCLMCPPRFNCTEVNAMLVPCYCVVGCMRTTQEAVWSGEECPNCERKVERIQQIYY